MKPAQIKKVHADYLRSLADISRDNAPEVSPPDPYYGYDDDEYAESLESNRLHSAAARFEELAGYIEGLRGNSTALSELAARLDAGRGTVQDRGNLLHRDGLRLWGPHPSVARSPWVNQASSTTSRGTSKRSGNPGLQDAGTSIAPQRAHTTRQRVGADGLEPPTSSL